MKRLIAIILALTAVFAVACSKEEYVEGKHEFLEYDYDLKDYISCSDPRNIEAEFGDPTVCTEEEIDEGVFQVILTYTEFTEIEDRRAEKYDRVVVNCTGSIDGVPVDDLTYDNMEIIIALSGNSDIAQLLQNDLIGKTKGDLVSAEYTYPNNVLYYGDYAGKKVDFVAEITSIAKPEIFECTDDFVQGLEGFEFKTVQEFRDALKEDILAAKKDAKVSAVWNAFFDSVEVKKYPEKEYQSYYKDYVEYYESSAKEYNITLEKFLQDYFEGFTVEGLYSDAKEYAEYMTKNDMAFIYLAKELKTELSEEEYKKGIEDYYAEESVNYDTIEEFIEYYGEKNLRRNVLWDKALLQMVDLAKQKAN